jgi:hypothetical protein
VPCIVCRDVPSWLAVCHQHTFLLVPCQGKGRWSEYILLHGTGWLPAGTQPPKSWTSQGPRERLRPLSSLSRRSQRVPSCRQGLGWVTWPSASLLSGSLSPKDNGGAPPLASPQQGPGFLGVMLHTVPLLCSWGTACPPGGWSIFQKLGTLSVDTETIPDCMPTLRM